MAAIRCTNKVAKMLEYAIFCILITVSTVATENDFFPDARESPESLKTINELIEERARQRFLEHWRRRQLDRKFLQRADDTGSAFTYHESPLSTHQNEHNPIEFAVGPSDPRFYESSVDSEYIRINFENENAPKQEVMHFNPNIILPPSPQDIKPKLPINVNQQSLGYKLRNKELSSDENLTSQTASGVVLKPVEMGGVIAMYIVALIGGISAAVAVGLLSIIIGWYTLHKKTKEAAEVEYPAYGVTGPNKVSSPTSDWRLAQSAQMYLYQHQKQQIIAVEHSSNTDDNNENHSCAGSEDDNEGDYTVYECPGLASAGEMEVKNPLFHDETRFTMEK